MIRDQAERRRALDPARSFIVQAPAGSGKTGLLVQRYLRLLSTVDRPESVVAMTFTRKAAAEMKERIYEALLSAASPAKALDEYREQTRQLAAAVLEQDRQKGWQLLDDASRLQIQTIDSLCALLTRQMPIVSGFGGELNVVEDATELYRLAARECLRVLADGSLNEKALLTRIGIYFDNDFVCVQNQIVAMLAQREQWRFAACNDAPGEIADFCQLLVSAGHALQTVFRRENTVDFTAVTRAAIAVLGSPEQPSDLLYALDYRIQHLLVDEFQDTSVAQYELINALTAQWSEGDNHTLFLVGDPMQSIYGFRGAEVSLFLQTWRDERMESVRLERVALRTNFRTTPEIASWVTESFSPIMLTDANGDVQFRESEAARGHSGIAPAFVPLLDDKGQQEAAAVAGLASEALKRGTVAILVRSRTQLAEILPELRSRDLPYEAIEIDKLGEEQHILDLIALTRAILHAGDRVSWLACLRAPWCGLTLADLAALAENERDRTMLDLLRDPAKIRALSPAGRTRAVRLIEILLPAVQKAGRAPLRDLVSGVWILLGGPALLRASHQLEDVDTFFDLLGSLEQGGTIRDFDEFNERLANLYARPATGENYIQLLTVHKAKGLEFDTVIIPHLGSRARTTENELLIWNETITEAGDARFDMAAQPRRGEEDPQYKAISDELKLKEENELKRLFYVACTRAKNELHLFASGHVRKDGAVGDPASGTFLKLIWGSVAEEFAGAVRRSRLQEYMFDPQPPSAPKTILRRLPQAWRLPRAMPGVLWHAELRQATASSRQISYEWVSDTSRHVGTVVHAILKQAAARPEWDRSRVTEMAPLIRSELLRLGVAESEQAAASDRVLRALTNTLFGERGRWILAPHAEARSEWALGGTVADRLITGTVDRMFRDERGRLWIIDFKISEHEGGQLERFLNEEQRRYRPQLENYAALISKQTSAPIMLGLYFPLLDAWREWQFETEFALFSNYTEK